MIALSDYLILSGNAFMGEVGVTGVSTRNVTAQTGLTGLGVVDVAAVWRL